MEHGSHRGDASVHRRWCRAPAVSDAHDLSSSGWCGLRLPIEVVEQVDRDHLADREATLRHKAHEVQQVIGVGADGGSRERARCEVLKETVCQRNVVPRPGQPVAPFARHDDCNPHSAFLSA